MAIEALDFLPNKKDLVFDGRPQVLSKFRCSFTLRQLSLELMVSQCDYWFEKAESS